MKMRMICTVVILVMLVTVGVCVSYWSAQQIIHTRGSIGTITVILRQIRFGEIAQGSAQWVDWFVGNHSYANVICLLPSDQLWYILTYGYDWSRTSGTAWDGWTFNEVKTVIDRFHYHGWKVIIAVEGCLWESTTPLYQYIQNEHPELRFVWGNGNPVGPSFFCAPGYFRNYTTNDNKHGISVGQRFIDVIATRLKQMIQDGLEWDGWFGADGWNALLGGWYGSGSYYTSDINNYISFSLQELSEWSNWTKKILPPNWASMTIPQKASWIWNNAAYDWLWYWDMRWARDIQGQIRKAIRDVRGDSIVVIDVDCASDYGGEFPGCATPATGFNLTLMFSDEYRGLDWVFVDMESDVYGSWTEQFREQAFVAGKTKSMSPNIQIGICVQPSHYISGRQIPLWSMQQNFLSQVQAYAWHNGQRYRCVNPAVIQLQYPYADAEGSKWSDEVWDNDLVTRFMAWVKNMSHVLNRGDLNPVYLGPTVVVGSQLSSYFWDAFNYTFAQWTGAWNLRYHPEYVNETMSSLFLDGWSLAVINEPLDNTQTKMLEDFTQGKLNILVNSFSGGGDSTWFSTIWNGDESSADSTFHTTSPSQGSSTTWTVLSSVTDSYGQWIISGYGGLSKTVTESEGYGIYKAGAGLITLAKYTDNYVSLAIYYNQTSGRFVYMRHLSGDSETSYRVIMPRDVLNKAIYWVSYCPINTTDALVDLKVFSLADGTILIPMMNHKDMREQYGDQQNPISTTLKINATALGLGAPSGYVMYWQSNSKIMTISDWSNVQINLITGADILVISPK